MGVVEETTFHSLHTLDNVRHAEPESARLAMLDVIVQYLQQIDSQSRLICVLIIVIVYNLP